MLLHRGLSLGATMVLLLCFRHTGRLSLGQRAMHGAGSLRLYTDNSRLWLQKLHSCGNSCQKSTTTTTNYYCVQVRNLWKLHFLMPLNVGFPKNIFGKCVTLDVRHTPVMLKPVRPALSRGLHGQQWDVCSQRGEERWRHLPDAAPPPSSGFWTLNAPRSP